MMEGWNVGFGGTGSFPNGYFNQKKAFSALISHHSAKASLRAHYSIIPSRTKRSPLG
jgi:hypothetical protein